jgi:hypothetical protein
MFIAVNISKGNLPTRKLYSKQYSHIYVLVYTVENRYKV